MAEDHAAEMSAKLDKVATALESSKNVALDSSKNVHVQNAHRLKKNSMISRQLRVTDDQAPGTSAAPNSLLQISNARLDIFGQDVLDEMTSTDVTKNRTQDNADMTQYAQRERRPMTTFPRLPGWETDNDDSLWELVSNKSLGKNVPFYTLVDSHRQPQRISS